VLDPLAGGRDEDGWICVSASTDGQAPLFDHQPPELSRSSSIR
jgi:hypothetical protein